MTRERLARAESFRTMRAVPIAASRLRESVWPHVGYGTFRRSTTT
jgi:hypothetical protein